MQADLTWAAPATYENRPEQVDHRSGILETGVHSLMGGVAGVLRIHGARLNRIVDLTNRHSEAMEGLDASGLKEAARELRRDLCMSGLQEEIVGRSFALIREAAGRTVGMRHFDVQLKGGYALLQGMVAEMETGEGKTLTATLAAGTAALAGIPVHMISVNDYLTARDAQWMGPIFEALGLTVGSVTQETSPELRRRAYQADVTYCTSKDLVFDYLRDRLTLKDCVDPYHFQADHLCRPDLKKSRLLLRGLHFAIVDEADSVLIDEARTPLIISKTTTDTEEQEFLRQAMTLAGELEAQHDFRITDRVRQIVLTDRGKERLRTLGSTLGPLWTGSVRREEAVRQALTARHLFHRDKHYLLADGKVQIIDENTGRLMPDRSWERGLHQLIEIKEACDMTGQRETVARISYQRFFRRYLRLSGMSGTVGEVSQELWSVYGVPVVRIPTNRPVRRVALGDQIYPTAAEKWAAVMDRVRQLHTEGQPVLIGTPSVAASEHASRLLEEAGLNHQVLNAKKEKEEAEIIARAGETGRITVATNMAGRGTDIKLGPGVAAGQGLHVILTERHETARNDRQLAGRCGRQGDPGSHEAMLSMEDALITEGHGGLVGWLAKQLAERGSGCSHALGRLAMRWAQKKIEGLHAAVRRDLYQQDKRRGEMLSFSGRSE